MANYAAMDVETHTLTEQQRRDYLDALGVAVWQPTAPCFAPEPAEVEADSLETAPQPDHAEATGDWATLESAVSGCTKCELHKSRTQTVFGVGHRGADWMIIGEAPGAEEDRRGEPFVGRAGQLLDKMLAALKLSRDTVFIANILKCRPPGNRDPHKDEAAACRAYLNRQIELVQPKMLLAVGRIAAQQLLDRDDPVGKLRGSVHDLNGVPLVVTYHPAYLLRSPSQKSKAWQDLKLARRELDRRQA